MSSWSNAWSQSRSKTNMKMDEYVPTMAGLFDMLNPGRKWARATSLFGRGSRNAFWTPQRGPPQLRWKLAAWTTPNFDLEVAFNFYFNSKRDQKWARQIHELERVAICFWVATWRSERAQLLQKFAETMKAQKEEGWHKHPHWTVPLVPERSVWPLGCFVLDFN